MYITKDDVEKGIFKEHLKALSRDDINIETAIEEAELEVKSFLTARYNIEGELQKTGTNRNKLVVKWVRCIAIWNIYNIASQVTIPESRKLEYQNAITALKLVQKEQQTVDGLERRTDSTNGGSNYIKFGGNSPRTNHY